ncbi:winged helix-turn-helix domain-containing protein [Enterococcus wangshanyuanii]|uniref:OmpR/PhoB-type domain-containing protein n=1 Tax=Enterococcus wangshanyuanii TaxID=2005703 RepID=A0ABQ1NPR3_9ENTE|nr:winged helix-turn-helix domain-containing protein [Enterococcus wangshanyuanii]GGC76858.1 hypothetical protein GCM10011573_03080 [Enterococcus wangshanyuanii]
MYKLGIISKKNYSEKIISEFEKNGFMLTCLTKEQICSDGLDGIFIEETEEHSISLICELVLSIRKESDVFIWVLSKKSTTVDRQVYLQLGVDNVFNSNYFPEEPLLVIRNTFTRKMKQIPAEQKTEMNDSEINSMKLDPRNLSLSVVTGENQVKEIALTKLEYRIMELLYSNPGKAFSYKEIHEALWKIPYSDRPYRVANLVFHIRDKLENTSIYIKTVRSKGYRLIL